MLDFFMYVRAPLFYGLQPNGVRAVPNFLLRASMPNLPYSNAPGTGHIVKDLTHLGIQLVIVLLVVVELRLITRKNECLLDETYKP